MYEELRQSETSDERKMKEIKLEYQNDEKLVEKIKDFELSEIVWFLHPEQ